MLVLRRHLGEVIEIGENIRVQVVDIGRDFVRLGIVAPTDIAVHRQEIGEAIRAGNTKKNSGKGSES